MKPYSDVIISESEFIREFDPSDTQVEDYIWHRDYENRQIIVLSGSNWKFQFDNELPFILNTYDELLIPKMVYHRIIPGNDILKLRIIETTQ